MGIIKKARLLAGLSYRCLHEKECSQLVLYCHQVGNDIG